MAQGIDFLDYTGNAALGGYAGAPNPAGAFDAFNRTQQRVFDNMAQWNVMKFQQGIKDRDDLYNQIAETQLPGDLLDEDREVLTKDIDSLKNDLLNNFDYASKNPKGMLETQAKIKKIKEGINTGKLRNIELTKKRIDYRDNPDPIYRDALGKEIVEDVKAGPFSMPKPYVRPDYYEKSVFANPAAVPIGDPEVVDRDGFKFKRQTVGTKLDDFFNYYAAATIPGMDAGKAPVVKTAVRDKDGNITTTATTSQTASPLKPFQLPTAQRFAAQTPEYMTPEHLEAANLKLKDIMRENGVQPGDPRYIDAIATKNPDGSYQLEPNPIKWAYGQSLVNNYKREVQENPDKDLQTMSATKAREAQSRAAANLNNVKAKLEPGRVQSIMNANNARAEASRKAGNFAEAKTNFLVNQAMEPVTQTIGKFANINKQNNFKVGAEMNVPKGLYTTLGIDQTWSAAPVVKDATIVAMSSQPKYEKGKVVGYIQPERVFALRSPDGDPNKMKLVAFYKQEDGKAPVQPKIIDPNQAWTEIIKHDSGYKLGDETIKLMGAGRTAIQQLFGSDAQGLDLGSILDEEDVVDTETNIPEGYEEAVELDD